MVRSPWPMTFRRRGHGQRSQSWSGFGTWITEQSCVWFLTDKSRKTVNVKWEKKKEEKRWQPWGPLCLSSLCLWLVVGNQFRKVLWLIFKQRQKFVIKKKSFVLKIGNGEKYLWTQVCDGDWKRKKDWVLIIKKRRKVECSFSLLQHV